MVITHNEVLARRHRRWLNWDAYGLVVGPVFNEAVTIDVNGVSLGTEAVAGNANNTLHEVGDNFATVFGGRSLKNNDVARVDGSEIN